MLASISQLDASDLLIGGFTLTVAIGAIGGMAQAILKDAGFGTILNGCLMLGGAAAGAAVRAATLGFQ